MNNCFAESIGHQALIFSGPILETQHLHTQHLTPYILKTVLCQDDGSLHVNNVQHLIIAGFNTCGTTPTYRYLSDQPTL